MSYAVRNDGQGWRIVSGVGDIGADEWFSTDTPPDPVPLPFTAEEQVAAERSYRDQELARIIWLRERHRDQLEIETSTTLTSEQFKELLKHIQALRNWPQSPDFPQIEHRPVAPPWLAEQTR